ncbi:MAG: ABC transporter ATP-binding protein [Bacteroidales bacterium]
MNPVVVNNLEKSYGEIRAISDINFEVEPGEIFGLIGPDGAGKTSIFRILATLILPDNGIAFMGGHHVVKEYKKIRQIIGYMPGRFSLYQDLSVEENLNFFASVFGTTIRENYDLVKDIYSQIEPFKTRKAGALSGGMKQKLALSCALIHRPEILILDEPTTGVDAVSRKEFWEMLRRLRDKGITILVSTPYMDEASLCDRVALISGGNIMQINTPADIVENFNRKLYGLHAENIYKMLDFLRNYTQTNSAYPFGQFIHFTPVNDGFNADMLKADLEKNGFKNFDIKEIKAGIEDCFMSLMDIKKT